MRVVVTGGAGFIGANLCRALAASTTPTEVVVIDDLSSGHRHSLDGLPVTFVQASILDADALDACMAGAHVVVHLAAHGSVPRSIAAPMSSHAANVTGTVAVLEAVRRASGPYLVFASSSAVYGANPVLPKTESLLPMPVSPYAASKLACEAYLRAYAATYGLDVLCLRFFNVFGPQQRAGHPYAAVVPILVDAALAGRPLPLHGDGRQTRDFTYVGSVVSVLLDALRRRVTSADPVNLGFGSRVSLLEVVAHLEATVGRTLPREHGPPRVGDVRDSQADQRQFRALFPDIEPVPLAQGLRETVEWFRER